MKYKKKCRILLLLFIVLSSVIVPGSIVSAQKWMSVSVSANTKYQVKLKWKKKAVSKYVIYRQCINKKNGTRGKAVKVATISGSKTSYVDKKVKKNYYYCYSIKGYKGKNVKYYGDTSEVYVGVSPCGWEDYLGQEGMVSPKFIYLEGTAYEGIKPDGFKIYRAGPDGKYKLIKTVKNQGGFKFKDKTVTAGGKYKYKVRAYKIIKGKKKYGSYSEVIHKNALNYVGKYTAEVICKNRDSNKMTDALILRLIPKNPYNGDLTVSGKSGAYLVFGDATVTNYVEDIPDDAAGIVSSEYLAVTAYSLDGKKWKPLKNNTVTLSGESTMYFKLQKRRYMTDSKTGEITGTVLQSFTFDPEAYEGAALCGFNSRYNTGIPTYMTMNIKTGYTIMGFDYEGIH